MLHENVMMVLHWRTSSFFVVKCFLLVSSLPNSNRRYTTSFGRFESQCNNIKKSYIHYTLNFYFNSNLFLNEYFFVLTNFCYLALAIAHCQFSGFSFTLFLVIFLFKNYAMKIFS